MKEYRQIGCSAVSMPNALFIVFLVLKLTGTVDWSWWWVTSPVWIGFATTLIALIFAIVVLYIKD